MESPGKSTNVQPSAHAEGRQYGSNKTNCIGKRSLRQRTPVPLEGVAPSSQRIRQQSDRRDADENQARQPEDQGQCRRPVGLPGFPDGDGDTLADRHAVAPPPGSRWERETRGDGPRHSGSSLGG